MPGHPPSFTGPGLASHRLHCLPLSWHSLSPPTQKGVPHARPLPRTASQARRGEAGRTHTQGSGRSTYSPFLLARRARLRQRFVLLFHLREQTEKSLAGQGWGPSTQSPEGEHPTGLSPPRAGLLSVQGTWGHGPGPQIPWGQHCPVTTPRMESLRPRTLALTDHHVARGGCERGPPGKWRPGLGFGGRETRLIHLGLNGTSHFSSDKEWSDPVAEETMTPMWAAGPQNSVEVNGGSIRLALAVCRLRRIPSAQSPRACSSHLPSSGGRRKVGQRQGFRRPNVFPTSDPPTANHSGREGTPRRGRGGAEEGALPELWLWLWPGCLSPGASWPAQRRGAESGANSEAVMSPGKRTDNMDTLKVLSVRRLAQNTLSGAGLQAGGPPPLH